MPRSQKCTGVKEVFEDLGIGISRLPLVPSTRSYPMAELSTCFKSTSTNMNRLFRIVPFDVHTVEIAARVSALFVPFAWRLVLYSHMHTSHCTLTVFDSAVSFRSITPAVANVFVVAEIPVQIRP